MDIQYIEDDATLRRLSEWKDRQLQQQQQPQHVVVPPTKNPNGSNHRHCPTTFMRDSSSSSSSTSSSCVTVSTELLSETSSSLDDTSFDESCSLSSSSSTCSLVLVPSNDEENKTNNNNQQQQQQQQQPRRRRRRRSKNNNNNNNKLVGRRVNVPNNKNGNCNSRFSSLHTPTTTPDHITEQEKNNYIAMDCEMVGIGPHGTTSRLARVALVSYDGSVLYDAHVQVTEVITDHRTHVSGILPSDLLSSNGAVSFDEARSKVRSLIRNKILVGHGLKNDFAALCIYDHPWYDIRDTARYEPFMRQLKHQHHQPDDDRCVVVDYDYINNNNDTMTPPPLLVPKKLKTLAHDKLGMCIQLVGMSHSPVEDAIAAMELYKRHRVKWEGVVQYKMDRTREMMMITTPRRN